MTNNEVNEPQSWTLPVDEDGILEIPAELLERLGWEEGDVLEWDVQENGSIAIKKIDFVEDGKYYSIVEPINDWHDTRKASNDARDDWISC